MSLTLRHPCFVWDHPHTKQAGRDMSGPGVDGLRAHQRPTVPPSALLEASLFIPSLAQPLATARAGWSSALCWAAGRGRPVRPADSVPQGPDAQAPPTWVPRGLVWEESSDPRAQEGQAGGAGREAGRGPGGGQDAWKHLPAAGWSEGHVAGSSVGYWWRQDIHPRPRCGGRALATAAGPVASCAVSSINAIAVEPQNSPEE